MGEETPGQFPHRERRHRPHAVVTVVILIVAPLAIAGSDGFTEDIITELSGFLSCSSSLATQASKTRENLQTSAKS
jgi:hypothetical protein